MSTSFDFPSKDFIPVLTADGSPTLRGREGEHMHSLEGALAETVYIYGSVTQTVLEENWPLRFVSVGLGLAYVELVVIAQAISRKAPWAEFYLHSFESDDFLRETLMSFLKGSPSEVHSEVLEAVAKRYEVPSKDLKSISGQLLKEGRWVIDQSLRPECAWGKPKFSALFFDAYSSKSSPELWTDEFLSWFLITFAGTPCALSTYAATGTLRRSLLAEGFEVQRLPGFGKKRESVRAHRSKPL